jgi:hypothetical protein
MKNYNISARISILVFFAGFMTWFLGFLFIKELLPRLHIPDGGPDFLGPLVAALVAIFVVFLTEWVKSRKEKTDHLHLLHRSIGAALENLTEIDTTIFDFAEKKLGQMIIHINNDIQAGNPSIGQSFVPLLHVFEISEELLRKFSGSGYIDILTIILINKSKDFRKMIDDINRQFEATLQMNNQIVISGININPIAGNMQFKKNIENFKSQMLEQEFRSNVRYYAIELIRAQIAVGVLQQWGEVKWRRTFKHVKSVSIVEEINEYFKQEVQARMAKYQPNFKTELKLTP